MRIFPEDKKKRKRILKANEIEVIDRQKNRCALCNKPLKINRYHIDHKKSLAGGGSNEVDNLQALCPFCHDLKSKKDSAKRAKAKRREKDYMSDIFKPIKIRKFKI